MIVVAIKLSDHFTYGRLVRFALPSIAMMIFTSIYSVVDGLFVSNFAGNPHEGYRVGLPFGGEWVEILNTDAEEFGGSGVVNVGPIIAEDTPWNGRPVSAQLRVPPLGALWLVPASQVR